MKKKTEKSIEQLALEDYAVDYACDKSSKLFKIISWIVAIFAAVIFYFSSEFDLFVSLGLIVGFIFYFVLYFSYKIYLILSKKAKSKIISSLAKYQKREIIEGYIAYKITQLQNENDYCKKESWQTGQIINDYCLEKFDLEKKALDYPEDKDYFERKIAKLEETIAYYRKQHDPYQKRILDNISKIRELEIKLETF
ncbi:hypothetical protein K9M48_05500 [Candidatus Gracilibacteria bacterium]|nr:hypothetical protein [Candidatus Gracilibacteria bacterium]